MSVREIPGVQDPVVRHARSTGWLAWKLRIEGRNGAPDYWFFKDGCLVIMEFKAPNGELSAQQVLRIKDLHEHGFEVHVLDNADAGRALLDSYGGML